MTGEYNRRVLLWCVIVAFSAIALQPRLLTLLGIDLQARRVARTAHSLPSNQPVTSSTTTASSGGQWSQEAVAAAFNTYAQSARIESGRMRTAFARLGDGDKDLGRGVGYLTKLDRLEAAEDSNGELMRDIADHAISRTGLDRGAVSRRTDGSFFRAREVLQHFVRDWSEEGAEERRVIFGPILDVLSRVPRGEMEGKRVLVPGSGLGRLAWEISELGYSTTANELSNYMNSAFQYLLDEDTTPRINTHTAQPWAHRLSHQRNPLDAFRSIPFPDALPRLSPTFQLSEGDFLSLTPSTPPTHPTSPSTEVSAVGYDHIVTLFFLDTSANVAAYLRQIHTLLRPGGTWINLGPLLWAGGGSVGLELSLSEVMAIAEEVGLRMFRQDEEVDEVMQPRSVRCLYTHDRMAMFERTYLAEFWVAERVG